MLTVAGGLDWDPFVATGLGPVLAVVMPVLIVGTLIYIQVLRWRDRRSKRRTGS